MHVASICKWSLWFSLMGALGMHPFEPGCCEAYMMFGSYQATARLPHLSRPGRVWVREPTQHHQAPRGTAKPARHSATPLVSIARSKCKLAWLPPHIIIHWHSLSDGLTSLIMRESADSPDEGNPLKDDRAKVWACPRACHQAKDLFVKLGTLPCSIGPAGLQHLQTCVGLVYYCIA